QQRLAVRVELLDAVVPGVGDPHVALAVERQTDLLAELAGLRALAAEHALERSVRREDLHALVARIGDVDLTSSVDGNRARTPEPAGIAGDAALGVAESAPLPQERALGIEALDAVVPGVGDVDVTAGSHGDAPRLVELPVAGAGGAPARREAAIGIERRHPRGSS